MSAIDLNADLGEVTDRDGIAADAAILAQVTSANVACGFHAGDPASMLRTCLIAAENSVTIGAHPGYRDAAGFGRRFIDYDSSVLEAETIYQVGAVRALAATVGAEVRYIKPHGALYNALAHHEAQALAIVRAAAATGLPLMVQAFSRTVQLAADAGVRAIGEGFADRGYRPDGTLVPRSEPGALLGRDEAIAQALRIAQTGTVIAVGGVEIEVPAESICLHGDSPGAVLLAAEIRAELERAGVTVRASV